MTTTRDENHPDLDSTPTTSQPNESRVAAQPRDWSRRCRLCGSEGQHDTCQAREMQFGSREVFSYFQCGACGCLQITEIPADMARYYSGSYYASKPVNERKYAGWRGFFRVLPFRASLFANRPLLRVIRWFAEDPHFACLRGRLTDRRAAVLDVGCGNGKHFLFPLRVMGFENAFGCDPFAPETIEYGNGLRIIDQPLPEAAEQLGRKWDVITFHHSFEHIPNPRETLATVAEILKPEGICVIRIPTCSSFAWEEYRENWVQLDAPRHLFLHSRESMKRLAEEVGLTLEAVRFDSTYFQFWGSENYQKDIALVDQRKGKGPAWWWRRRQMNRWAAKLNAEGRGDQAAFVLRRSGASN